jgi:hypothetical protein
MVLQCSNGMSSIPSSTYTLAAHKSNYITAGLNCQTNMLYTLTKLSTKQKEKIGWTSQRNGCIYLLNYTVFGIETVLLHSEHKSAESFVNELYSIQYVWYNNPDRSNSNTYWHNFQTCINI